MKVCTTVKPLCPTLSVTQLGEVVRFAAPLEGLCVRTSLPPGQLDAPNMTIVGSRNNFGAGQDSSSGYAKKR